MKDVIKNYLIENANSWDANQGEMRAKAIRNSESGERQLLSGEIKPFEGYNASALRKQINVIAVLDEKSQKNLSDRLKPYRVLNELHGVPSIDPSFWDLPHHVTLQPGAMNNLSESEIREEVMRVKRNPLMTRVIRELAGLAFYMDDLVFGGNTYLSSSQPIPSFNWARKEIQEIYLNGKEPVAGQYGQKYDEDFKGVVPTYFGDIVHATEERKIAELSPVSGEYLYSLGQLRATISSNPIPVRVGKVSVGTSYDFMNANAPHLIRRHL